MKIPYQPSRCKVCFADNNFASPIKTQILFQPEMYSYLNVCISFDNNILISYLQGSTCQRIHLQEIFAVTHETGSEKSNGSDEIELSPTNQFTIHNITRCNNHKWRTKKLSFACEDCILCQAWVDGLRNSLAGLYYNISSIK